MTPDLAKKYSGPVPRYTSYPTAPHFTAEIGPETYAGWLAALAPADCVSLYFHIPFCNSLCWYCGCNTKMVNRYTPISAYMETLLKEMDTVRAALPARLPVSHIHFGGGSPSILSPADISRIGARYHAQYEITEDAEIAVEIDPRYVDDARIKAFADIGVNRLSCGVQDFNADVQAAINRHQSFKQTAAVVDSFRRTGINSVNIDLVYGLPHQTRDSVDATISKVLELDPDRIALFGYAHLPSRLAHQRLIDTATLPNAVERFAQSNRAASRLTEAGYVRIGFDHFARPDDTLAQTHTSRNFQGYTSDDADTLIGFGASAIGKVPQGYVQNAVPTAEYSRRIARGELATAKGFALSDEDRARAYVINALMCNMTLQAADFQAKFATLAPPLIEEAASLAEADQDGLFVETAGGFEVTERGRPFLRAICSCFDAYLGQSPATHSAGV